MTDQQAADAWYPGVSNPNLTTEEKLQMIQMYNQDWAEERQREQEIWSRLQQASQPIYAGQRRW